MARCVIIMQNKLGKQQIKLKTINNLTLETFNCNYCEFKATSAQEVLNHKRNTHKKGLPQNTQKTPIFQNFLEFSRISRILHIAKLTEFFFQ